MIEPIKTQEEYNEVENNIVRMTVETLGITEKAARLRVKALVKSGIMARFGPPEEILFQIAIDAAMHIPQLGESEE